MIADRLFGMSYLQLNEFWRTILVIVDYTEIPAIVTTTILYINELRKKVRLTSIVLLILLNSQWLHLFWITDEFVINSFTGAGTILPVWLAWAAILIDYLELPIIFDITWRFIGAIKRGKTSEFIREEVI